MYTKLFAMMKLAKSVVVVAVGFTKDRISPEVAGIQKQSQPSTTLIRLKPNVNEAKESGE